MAHVKTTTIHHITGKRFLGVTPDGMQLMIDGENHAKTGMNPMEVLLNALGACAAFDVVEMIRNRRLDLLSYRLELEGDQYRVRSDVASGRQRFDYQVQELRLYVGGIHRFDDHTSAFARVGSALAGDHSLHAPGMSGPITVRGQLEPVLMFELGFGLDF